MKINCINFLDMLEFLPKKEIYMKELFRKYLMEFIGTFFLFLTIGCSIFPNGRGSIPPIAIGLALMVMVYAGGRISGGHYNPAVSFAACIKGALSWKQFIPYAIAQILGAAAAAGVVLYLVAVPPYSDEINFSIPAMIICELLFTFALCFVVLSTATSKSTEGNSFYGLAIGGTLATAIFATLGTCLGAFNPAVALGLLIMKAAKFNLVWITILANLAGGAIAAYAYKFIAAEHD